MFYVGQKVVAIRDHSQKLFKKGQEFIVLNVKEPFCKCGIQQVDIGIPSPVCITICHDCCKEFQNNGIAWFCNTSFAPLETYRESYSIAIELVQQMEQVDKQKIFNPKKETV